MHDDGEVFFADCAGYLPPSFALFFLIHYHDKTREKKVNLAMAPPTFMGLTGRPLSLMVSTVATTGFVLFGYDQGVMVCLFRSISVVEF